MKKRTGGSSALQNQRPQLDDCEWNFDASKLPDSELKSCFFYEFAREFARRSAAYRPGIAAVQAARAKGKGGLAEMQNVSHLFGKTPGPVLIQTLSPEFVGTPWHSLSPTVRVDISHRVAMEAADRGSFQESIALCITLERELPEWRPAGVTGFPSWVLLDNCFHSDPVHKREHGFLAVNWIYTDDQLAKQFKGWLKAMRGARKPSKSQQGKTKFRQHLHALGGTRLLKAGFTAEGAMAETQRFLKDSDGHSYPLYDTPRSWYMAKHAVERVLISLFPSEATVSP